MNVKIQPAPLPWEINGLRGEDFSGTRIGEVSAYVEAVLTDTDGFEAVALVKVDAATVAKIADGSEPDPAKAIQTIVDAALVGAKARILAERAAEAAAEQAGKDAEAAAAVLAGRVKTAFANLGAAKAIGEVEALEL